MLFVQHFSEQRQKKPQYNKERVKDQVSNKGRTYSIFLLVAETKDGDINCQLVGLLIQHFGPEQDILTSTGNIAMKFGINIHDPQRMIPDDYGDPQTII